jgi:hypothetical protein
VFPELSPLAAITLLAAIVNGALRRVCMSFDAWVVGFGLSWLLRALHVVEGASAYYMMAGVILVDAVLLYRFSAGRRMRSASVASAVTS